MHAVAHSAHLGISSVTVVYSKRCGLFRFSCTVGSVIVVYIKLVRKVLHASDCSKAHTVAFLGVVQLASSQLRDSEQIFGCNCILPVCVFVFGSRWEAFLISSSSGKLTANYPGLALTHH